MEPIVTPTTLEEGTRHLEDFFDSNIVLMMEMEKQLERLDSIHPELLTDEETEKLNDMRYVTETNIFFLKKLNEDPKGLYNDLIDKSLVAQILGN